MVPCDQPVSPTDDEWCVLEKSSSGEVCFVGQWLAARAVPGYSSLLRAASCLFSALCGTVRSQLGGANESYLSAGFLR